MRRGAESWHHLRILVDYRYLHKGTNTFDLSQETFLKSKLVPAAVQFLQWALEVRDETAPQPLSTEKHCCNPDSCTAAETCSCQAIFSGGTGHKARDQITRTAQHHDLCPCPGDLY